ncbi:MAG: hypothetical protein LKE64_02095 [Solobacterium sp.]|jgi:sterol desaturase/sphingolipid hydroxylase (fatty acid hydroxylase superfamily)|nr:hypothetical protein [Solobacterium sp.]MCH4049767.1 hypothetical protein [Solobacterium sp.]MCH4073452.1 hypothetical protein [Solobacterium sp.]
MTRMDELKICWIMNLFGCGFAVLQYERMAVVLGVCSLVFSLMHFEKDEKTEEEILAAEGIEIVIMTVCGMISFSALVLSGALAMSMVMVRRAEWKKEEKKGMALILTAALFLGMALQDIVCMGWLLMCAAPFVMTALFAWAERKDLQEIQSEVK